jgi:hypothetical protein
MLHRFTITTSEMSGTDHCLFLIDIYHVPEEDICNKSCPDLRVFSCRRCIASPLPSSQGALCNSIGAFIGVFVFKGSKE